VSLEFWRVLGEVFPNRDRLAFRTKRVGRIAIRRLGFSGEANYAFGALNPEWRITIRVPTDLSALLLIFGRVNYRKLGAGSVLIRAKPSPAMPDKDPASGAAPDTNPDRAERSPVTPKFLARGLP
jgi:hypothetical protein